jgi:hypothetical protein
MFNRSREVTFLPYGSKRSRGPVPRWLVLLLVGSAVGAGGVLYVQDRYLPERLSAEASTRLRAAFDGADAERTRLQGEFAQTKAQLATTLAEKRAAGEQVAAARATVQRLQDDMASLVEALPPDPRNGVVAVRAARFAATNGMLNYSVVLTRERAGGAPLACVMRLTVAGASPRQPETSVALKPIALTLGRHEVLRGSIVLPEGFTPRQTTVQVLDRNASQVLGMRVLTVQ